mgnify:CR=1 FL=1
MSNNLDALMNGNVHSNTSDDNSSYSVLNDMLDAIRSQYHWKSEDELHSSCIKAASQQKAILKEKDSEQGKQLPVWAIAQLFEGAFHYYLFDKSEDARIAFYNPVSGIYTRNLRELYRFLSFFDTVLTEDRAKKIVFQLTNKAKYNHHHDDGKYIAVNNGLFNLETKKLEGFTPLHPVFTKVATNYNPDAKSPNIDGWTVDKMFDQLACGDKDEVQLFWQIINDALNGNRSRGKAFFLVGNIHGNNGKGTFQTLIENLVGEDNYGNLKINEFEKRFALSVLDGKTVCIGDDIQTDYIKSSSSFNSIVTGDPVNIEIKQKSIYTTALHCTIIQSCNTMPMFAKKGGTMRRLILVPFEAQFTDKTDNKAIKEQYLKRKDVLEYVLKKALTLPDFDKFIEPARSKAMKEEFEADNNSAVGFLKEVFEPGQFERIPVSLLYQWYVNYCSKNGFTPIRKPKRFTKYFLELLGNSYDKGTARITEEQRKHILEFNEQCKDNNQGAFYVENPFKNPVPMCIRKVDVEKR